MRTEFWFERLTLGPTQTPIQWVPGALSLGVKLLGREADNLPPSSADIKNAWTCTSTPPISPHVVVLSWIKHRDNSYF